jgi:hypothetical protein
VLGPREDQRPAVAAREGGHNAYPIPRHDSKQVVDHRGGRGGRVDGMLRWLGQEAAHQDVDGVIEGRGEQQSLASRRGGIK